MRLFSRIVRGTAGGAMIEFALAGPILLLLTMGAVDFGRAFYHSVTVSNAANTGALVGSRNTTVSDHYTEMNTAATQDAADSGTVTATSARVCMCPGASTDPNGTVVDCITGTCTGYGLPRIYATCEVSRSFSLAAKIPRLTQSFTVRRKVYMRVQ